MIQIRLLQLQAAPLTLAGTCPGKRRILLSLITILLLVLLILSYHEGGFGNPNNLLTACIIPIARCLCFLNFVSMQDLRLVDPSVIVKL